MPLLTQLFAHGATLADGAAALKISIPTFCRKLRSDPALAEAVKLGREMHRLRRTEMVAKFHAFIEGSGNGAL